MGWLLPDEDHIENQIAIYEELLNEKQEEFNSLDGAADSPQVEIQRQQIGEQIKQIKLNIEQARESIDREENSKGREPDFFED